MSDTKKDLFLYLTFVIVCIIVNLVYSQFSHNVSSIYMTYMFIIPIVGYLMSLISSNNKYKNLIASSTLTITLASFLEGIVVIAGTTSNFVYVLLVIGILLLITSLFFTKSIANK
jgi:hypothetical protein